MTLPLSRDNLNICVTTGAISSWSSFRTRGIVHQDPLAFGGNNLEVILIVTSVLSMFVGKWFNDLEQSCERLRGFGQEKS